MDRTVRAMLVAGLIAFVFVAGLGWFLGFDPGGAAIAGAIVAMLAAVLLWGAARRAEGFHGSPEGSSRPRPDEPGGDET